MLEWLGLRHVEIKRVPERPTAGAPEPGPRISATEAQRRLGRAPLVSATRPEPGSLHATGGGVTLVYGRLRLTELAGQEVFAEKMVGPGTQVRAVTIDGARGAWITGAPHTFIYVDPTGELVQDEAVLAGDTLVWERSGLVLRIEGARSLAEALTLARSLD